MSQKVAKIAQLLQLCQCSQFLA